MKEVGVGVFCDCNVSITCSIQMFWQVLNWLVLLDVALRQASSVFDCRSTSRVQLLSTPPPQCGTLDMLCHAMQQRGIKANIMSTTVVHIPFKNSSIYAIYVNKFYAIPPEYLVGTAVYFECTSLSGNITFTKQTGSNTSETQITNGGRISISGQTLGITDIQPEDEGLYKCSNDTENATQNLGCLAVTGEYVWSG